MIIASTIFSAGGAAAIYAKRYVTHEDISPLRAEDRAMDVRIRSLEHKSAAFEASMKATQEAAEDTRDAVKSLTQYLLANPSARGARGQQ